MPAKLSSFRVSSKGDPDIIDISSKVSEIVRDSEIKNGLVNISVAGSTAAITTIEYESGVINDLRKAIERLVPSGLHYEHDARWGDGNGFSHVRAALIGGSLAVSLREGQLLLGTWQQIVLLDFDNRPRNREIFVQVVGE